MSKELDDFYKKYSARITEMDDMPLVKVMDGGKFKLLSIEEYEEMTNKLADLEAKLAESEKRILELQEDSIRDNQIYNEELVEKEKEIVILEKALECACSDLQSSGGAYINAQEAVKGNEIILPVENAMQIEYEIALSELDIIKPENTPEKYQNQQSKNILYQDKISFAVEQLEKVKEHNDNLVCDDEDYYNYIKAFIDNQIKMLKEGNKNEN